MPEHDPNATATATAVATSLTLQGSDEIAMSAPALVLAVGADGLRGPERVDLLGRELTVGRGFLGYGQPIADHRMSRQHFTLRLRGDEWHVLDAGSSNGTRLNGSPLTAPAPLVFGDVICAGQTLFVFAPGGHGSNPDEQLVGHSMAAGELLDALRLVAPYPTSVLLLGETGVGKEVAARTLHRLSERGGEFLAVNCGAFAEGTLESELFGHRKGAFTGAVEARPGVFRAAHGGTLFLDEVGEMPLGLQVKLLRTLEARTVRPVGETRDVPVDVRVVAATNRDLVDEVKAGRFRSDLYARLSQWPVRLPALRDRRDDIPLLVEHVLRTRHGGPRPLDPALAEALLLHPWPLNVRGLVNVVNMAAIATPAGQPLQLGREVRTALAADSQIAAMSEPVTEPSTMPPSPAPSLPQPLPADEVVQEALRRNEGKVAVAARELGGSRQQIYRWLKARGETIDAYRPDED